MNGKRMEKSMLRLIKKTKVENSQPKVELRILNLRLRILNLFFQLSIEMMQSQNFESVQILFK